MNDTPLSSGLDLSWVDPEVRVQDDLFGHVNGRWLREHTIPADRSVDGEFHRLRDEAEADVRAIIERLAEQETDPSTDTGRIGLLYRQFMDEEAIERRGTAPLDPLLAQISDAEDLPALARLMGSPDAGATLISAYVWLDDKDSSRYLVRLHQSGLGLPERSYYLEDAHAETREKYVEHLRTLADLASLPGRAGLLPGDALAQASAVMDYETRLARAHVDMVRLRDREKSYNPMGRAELDEALPGFPWDAYIEGTGADPAAFARVSVGQPEYLTALAELLAGTDLPLLRTWLALRTVSAYAPYLSDALVRADFAFQGTVLSGAEEIRERWKRGVALVEGALGMAVGREYVAEHFPPEAKDRMEELVRALLDAYRDSIGHLDWMSEATREKALAKLERFTPKIAYPRRWRTYEELELDPEDLVGSVRASRRAEAAHEFGKVLGPVDDDEWHMTPQTVNAYYNPGANEIVFPAAILRPPFFDPVADDAANFGGIGAVIGHEIGHGFDDQGSKYDGEGNLVSWWTEEDRAAFERRTRALVDQYASLTPRQLGPEHHVNGELTIGENIGDLGGLSIALRAYLATAEDPAREIDGFTGIQRVFLSWATVWRMTMRPQEAVRRLAIDPHAPGEFRCNMVASHIDEFHEAFGTGEGDGMYLSPKHRVRIW